MAATELLDYNQVQEQSPSTGDSIPATGGPIIWQFRADPNLAWDPSQSFFAMDVTIKNRAIASGSGTTVAYEPTPTDLRPFFPLRCFNGASHVIDGVTVAQTSNPYLDKIIQEKFLHETTLSNYSNFEALQLCRAIDDGIKEHNLFRAHADSLFDLYEQGWRSSIQLYNGARQGAPQGTDECFPTHTVIFQPPFDFWTKHQRVSGGNHQVTLNLRAGDDASGGSKWGEFAATTCVGLAAARAAADLASDARIYGGGTGVVGGDTAKMIALAKQSATSAEAEVGKNLFMDIHRIRLMRRMVRFTIERPIATQEYNLTEMQLYVGQSSKTQQTQNFLLPSSTFGLVFFWRKSDNAFYDVHNDYPVTQIGAGDGLVSDGPNGGDHTLHFMLNEFYFTYGGETYPAQRINDISGLGAGSGVPLGYEKLQMLTNQLMGTYNMPMEYLNTSYGGTGLMERLDSQMFFFPVAKHSNSDNSDLQVFWKGEIRDAPSTPGATLGSANSTAQASLCVVALYDARIELSYNSANQLEKVTKTEWK